MNGESLPIPGPAVVRQTHFEQFQRPDAIPASVPEITSAQVTDSQIPVQSKVEAQQEEVNKLKKLLAEALGRNIKPETIAKSEDQIRADITDAWGKDKEGLAHLL